MIEVERGVVVRLPGGKTLSTRGGTYDISGLSDEDAKKILAIEGVSEAKGGPPAKPTADDKKE